MCPNISLCFSNFILNITLEFITWRNVCEKELLSAPSTTPIQSNLVWQKCLVNDSEDSKLHVHLYSGVRKV